MGYETKLLIGVRKPVKDQQSSIIEKPMWFNVIATIDLCKCGYSSNISKLISKQKIDIPEVYWFDDYSNNKVIEDDYGESFKTLPVSEVYEVIKLDTRSSSYKRFRWTLDLLSSFNKNPHGEDIRVAFYGY